MEERMELVVGNRYRTRDGRIAYIYSDTGSNDKYRFKGLLDGAEKTWMANGMYYTGAPFNAEDIVSLVSEAPHGDPVPKRMKTIWLNIYDENVRAHPSRTSADAHRGHGRRACVEQTVLYTLGDGILRNKLPVGDDLP